ncbi:hypothetical protein ACIQU4_18270 [Streptomyces sp. NPDC090741]|uniref:hypothetical protein n=1 Tax=Streptomyces sp. NPDC090741 TaxID=3365967 RepID=UPI0037FF5625
MIKKILLIAVSTASVLSASMAGASATVQTRRDDEQCAGAVLERHAQSYSLDGSEVKGYGQWNKGDCLTRIVHEGAVKGYFTKQVESKQYVGMPRPFDYITWTPAKEDAAGVEYKSFYTVYRNRDKVYLDGDDIPAGLPKCDAKVKGPGARKYEAKVRIYGEPSRDLKSFVRTWNEIESFRATDSYYRPGDCILLTGSAAKHDGKDVYETNDPSGSRATVGPPWVMADEIEVVE